MIERKQTTTPATTAPIRTPQTPATTETPKAKAAATTPTMATDADLTSKPKDKPKENNPLADSPGRTGADVVSGSSSAAEVLKDSSKIGEIAETAGTRVSWLAKIGGGISKAAQKVVSWGDDIARVAPKVAKGFLGFAKAAPFIGVGVAALDIGKAVLEKDPEKKKVAEGQAALSVIGGAAGVVGVMALATPLAPVLLGIGIGTAVLSVADTFLFGGKVSKAISSGMHAVADGAKAVGSAVADGAKKVWGALSSL